MKQIKIIVAVLFALFVGITVNTISADTVIKTGTEYNIDIDSNAGKGYSNTIDTSFGIYKHQKGKLVKLAGSMHGKYVLVRVPTVKINGKGKVYITGDTPIELGVVCYYGNITLKMKNGKLKLVNKDTINFTDYSKKYKYKANEEIKVYSKANTTSKVLRTLKSGDKLQIIKIKFKDTKLDEWGTKYVASTSYAYIKDSKGNKGLIRIKAKDWNLESNRFVESPA